MAFPAIGTITPTTFASSVTTMGVAYPGSLNAGDGLLAFAHVRNAGTWTIPSGWNQLTIQNGGGGVGCMTTFYKLCNGTSDGTAGTWTASVATTGAWQVRKFTGWDGTNIVGSAASGDATNANPPNLAPSWGSDDNLWVVGAGHSAASASAFTAAPGSYSGFVNTGASSGGAAVSVASAYRELTGTSEDPGTFTVASNRWWSAVTIAIKPSGAASSNISKRGVTSWSGISKLTGVTKSTLSKVTGVSV